MNKNQQSFFYSDNQDQPALEEDIEEIQSIIKMEQENQKIVPPATEKRKRGRPKKQQNIPQKTNVLIINRFSFHKIYFELCQDIDKLNYCRFDAFQSPFYQYVFDKLKGQLKERQKGFNPNKIRSEILKKAIGDFIKSYSPRMDEQQLEKNASINIKIYQQAHISPPPDVLNTNYIVNLFKSKEFKQFYTEYIEQNRIKQYFLKKSFDEVLFLCQSIQGIGQCLLNNEGREQQFNKIKKPMTLAQVKQLERQGQRLYYQYCQ